MFKKLTLYTFILFSYVSPSFSLTDEEIKAADDAARIFIEQLKKTLDPNRAWTLTQMLDFFSDKNGNDAHLIMSDFYLDTLENATPCSFNEAFVKLALKATEIAQTNIDNRPETKSDLTKFIENNNKLIQFVSTR